MKKQPRRMRILITVEVLSDDTEEQTPAEDTAQTDLSRFVRLEDLPSPPTPQRPQESPAGPSEGINAHTPPLTVENGRQPHLCYADGRKVHTCSKCGAPHRRLNPKTGRCGEGDNCRTEYAGVHPAFRGVE